VVAALLSFFLFAFAREITVFVGSPMFEPAVPLLRVLALVPIARTAHQPLTMLFQALKRPGIVFRLAAIKFVTEFGCYFALVPLLGLAGAAVSNLAGAVVAYGAALAGLAREMPAGADERRSSVLRSALLFVPLFVLAWLASERLQEPASIVVRGLLAMLSVWLVFAAGLVDHEDIGRVAEIPLESRWMRRVRDLVVNGAFAVARDRAGGRA
jgi:O-antigen/teichoic acid export membrane protein